MKKAPKWRFFLLASAKQGIKNLNLPQFVIG